MYSLHPYPPLDIYSHSKPPVRIARFKNGRVKLQATLRNMAFSQVLLIRTVSKGDLTRIMAAANGAGVRVKIEHFPLVNMIAVTSRGPSRKRRKNR